MDGGGLETSTDHSQQGMVFLTLTGWLERNLAFGYRIGITG
jgi:hypothetical protein